MNRPHPLAGIALTPEHRKKIGDAQRGRNFTEEHKRKLSVAHVGKIPWNKGTKGVMKGWNKGIPVSPETRLRLSIARIGKTPWNKGKSYSPELREKLSLAHIGTMTGSANPNWKGGTKSERQRIMGTALYLKWRKAIFERDDYRCFSCGERGGRLEAHHIFPWAYFPRLRFALENGVTLCEQCHLTISPCLKGPDNVVAPAGMIFQYQNA
jgi:hypothetical protein